MYVLLRVCGKLSPFYGIIHHYTYNFSYTLCVCVGAVDLFYSLFLLNAGFFVAFKFFIVVFLLLRLLFYVFLLLQ